MPEVGKPNPRADSFSLYLNYVGNKILDNLLPKSKLGSKVHYVYTDKALKKRRKEEENKRIKSEKMNALVKQAEEHRMNAPKKIIKKDQGIKDVLNSKNQVISSFSPKTPAKKSFPAKIREQVNSCKKPQSKKIISALAEYSEKQSQPHSNIKISQNKMNYKQRRGNNEFNYIPSSYYSSEYKGKNQAKIQNKINMSRTLLKDPIKTNPSAMETLISPPRHSSGKGNKQMNEKLSRHGNRNHKKVIQNPQMGGGSKIPSKRISSSHYKQAMESGSYTRGKLRNGGMGVITTVSNSPEAIGMDIQQVPVKVFDMSGHVRHPMRVEKMQGSTVHRKEMDFNGRTNAILKRTASKKSRSRERRKITAQNIPKHINGNIVHKGDALGSLNQK